MAIRKKFLDYDARRTPKTAYCCVRCQKDIDPAKPHRVVHVVDGGSHVLHPADEAIYQPDGGDMGCHPIGNECARLIGFEFTTAA